MRIALFAAGHVGLETAKVFGEYSQPLDCLIVDADDSQRLNATIVATSGVRAEHVLSSTDLEREDRLEWLESLGLDLAILAWWPYLLRPRIFTIPRLGCLNFHPSLLPYNRGKDPNFWSLRDGSPSGATIHFVDEGVDTGDIAFQTPIETSWEDTGESLYEKSLAALVALFRENFPRIRAGDIPRIPQQGYAFPAHQRRELDPASEIRLGDQYSARDLLNLLRARTFPPYPAAWFVEDGQRYEVRITITKAGRS